MPRLVRRQPWAERIKDYLNVYDLLIWISEEVETSEYPWEQWAYIAGIVCNFLFMLARANSRYVPRDDVFEESSAGSFISAFSALMSYGLIITSITNAFYTFMRKRHYRMFEKSVESAKLSTPSARRVRVDSSPVASSPLRFLSSLLSDDSARSRAHADSQRDVWEISVWDPLPTNLRFFCTFSPGHALLYWLFIPVSPTDPRPSTTIATAMFLAALLSTQLILTQGHFSQQIKDTALIHKEVLNEYDTKYVHPRTQPVMRDVGVQFDEDNTTLNTVETYSPVTIVNRGFRPNPNPNYTGFIDPDHGLQQTPTRPVTNFSNLAALRSPTGYASSPLGGRQSQNFRASVGTGDGGNLGVYTHARSPLKKAQARVPARQSTGVGPDVAAYKRAGYTSGANGVASPRYPR